MSSCGCGDHGQGGAKTSTGEILPTASLDDVAAQMRKDFAAQTQPPPQPSEEEVAQAQAAEKRKKKSISQAFFDEVVSENMELDEELTLVKAMADAVIDFGKQGVDLTGLCTTERDLEVATMMKELDELARPALQGEATVLADGAELLDKMAALAKLCAEDEVARTVVGAHGGVGASSGLCKKYCADEPTVLAALRLLSVLLKSFENREVIPVRGIEGICDCLVAHPGSAEVQRAAFAAVTNAIKMHEANKRNFRDRGIQDLVLKCLRAHQGAGPVMVAVCRFTRVYLSDDDRRVGVQPGTFSRARELGENYNTGALQPLVGFLASPATVADEKLVVVAMSAVKAVAVNDLICKHYAEKGGLDASLVAFEAHITDETVATAACTLLKAVARNDDIKRTVGAGTGLGLLLRAMEEHAASYRVVGQALACLSVLCLRQPGICESIAKLGVIQLITSAMSRHKDAAMVQRPAIITLRNMVSSFENKEQGLCQRIIDEGAETLIRQARATFPECEEVAYAALRDLGLEYHN